MRSIQFIGTCVCAARGYDGGMDDTPETNTFNCEVDISLLNNPSRLRERADAIDAWNAGNPVDKYIDGHWIQIEEQTAFFFDRRYRARPTSTPPPARGGTEGPFE